MKKKNIIVVASLVGALAASLTACKIGTKDAGKKDNNSKKITEESNVSKEVDTNDETESKKDDTKEKDSSTKEELTTEESTEDNKEDNKEISSDIEIYEPETDAPVCVYGPPEAMTYDEGRVD